MSDESTDPESIPEYGKLVIELFNHTWSLIDLKQRTPDQIDEMIHSAYASSYHWLRGGEPANQARGHWQIPRLCRGRAKRTSLVSRHSLPLPL